MDDKDRKEFLAAARRYLFGSESGSAAQTANPARKVC